MLLADLHIHTTWSDGKLPMTEVVDLFGRTGHDVIAITDHVVNTDNVVGKVTHRAGLTVTADNLPAIRLYSKVGFQTFGRELGPFLVTEPECVAERALR